MTVQTLTFHGYPGKSKDRGYPIPGFKGEWMPGETREITDDYARTEGWSIPAADVVVFVTTVLNNGMPKGQEPFSKGTVAEDVGTTDTAVKETKPKTKTAKRSAAPTTPKE